MDNPGRVATPLVVDGEEVYSLKDVIFLVLQNYSEEIADQFMDAFRLTYPMNTGMLETEVKKMQAFLITVHRLMSKLEGSKSSREFLQQGKIEA